MYKRAAFLICFLLSSLNPIFSSDFSLGDSRGKVRALDNLPLYFIENQGQVDHEGVAYYVKGSDKTVYFTEEGLTFALCGRRDGKEMRYAIRLDFVGANPDVKPVGEDRQKALFSYFKGSAEEWKTGLPAFGTLIYPNLWPSVDLRYSGTVNQLKYEFIVQPGADPGRIRLSYEGATGLTVSETGELNVTTPLGSLVDGVPFAYQLIEGKRKAVSMQYVLEESSGENGFSYGFNVGTYDPGRPLFLDPAMLMYCGYIGGAGPDFGYDIAVDALGNAYVTGSTHSDEVSFPVTVGPDLTFNGNTSYGDAFVAKVNAQGTALDYCGYIGGNVSDAGWGIAVDDQGNAYVTGTTDSDELSFPVIAGPGLTHSGGTDAFVAKVNAQGTALDYCGYIGGNENDPALGIAVDSQRNAYVTGYTSSDESSFPVTVGPDLTFNFHPTISYSDAWVAKVNAQGTNLEYCGYIGGIKRDESWGIAVDGQGNAYVTGKTSSDESSFPVTIGPDLTYNGTYDDDAFVARVNAQGTGLDYCGYIGGSGDDDGWGITVDVQENAYVVGRTLSKESSFPVSVGPDLTFNGGSIFAYDAFVAKVTAQGTGLDYCGYIGGSNADWGRGVAVDGHGNAYVTGDTESDESSFPVTVGPDLSFNGGTCDGFLARVNAQGAGLDYCGYMGGVGDDSGFGVAADDQGNAYVSGGTNSDESSFPVTVGPDLTFNGGSVYWGDAFVAKVSYGNVIPDVKVNGQDADFSVPACTPLTLTVALDPGYQMGQLHDWWLFVTMNPGVDDWDFWWRWPGKWVFSTTSKRVFPVPVGLETVNCYTVTTATLPVGAWRFTFALDAPNNIYEGTYEDNITVTVY